MIRIAYCLYGQPRRIEEGFAIVQKFQQDNPDVQIDFFYHTWFIPNTSNRLYEASPWRPLGRDDLLIRPDAIEKLNSMYMPKAYQVDEPIQFDKTITQLYDSILYKHTPTSYITNLNNVLSQIYSMQQVRKVLQNYSKETGTTYQYVILSRFDFLKEIKIRINSLRNDILYVSNTTEKHKCLGAFYLSNYDIFLNVANVFDNLPNIVNNTELMQLIKGLHIFECNLNAENIITTNYLFYYRNHRNIEFTHLIPNFV
jgi:hypothetical protein